MLTCPLYGQPAPIGVAPIPTGYDAYLQWHRWPEQRLGVRAYMSSTYDRAGGNEGADASHFLYQLADDQNVTLDATGAGILYFARFNHWHGSPWHFTVDDKDHLVAESSTVDPRRPVRGSKFIPEELFKEPLAYTWSTTKGADLSWLPIPFEKSLRLAYSRTHYGTGYYIFHKFVPGIPLSQPIQGWDAVTPSDRMVLALLAKSGEPPEMDTDADFPAQLTLLKTGATTVMELKGPAVIRTLSLVFMQTAALDTRKVRLRITWDGRKEPSVDAPLPLFFGAGTLYNRDDREYLVKAFPVSIRFDERLVHLDCYFPMPFFKSAKIELVTDGAGANLGPVGAIVQTTKLAEAPSSQSYFHATYRDHPRPEKGKDLVLLDTRNLEGSEHWSGSFIGTSFIFSHNAVLTTLEGDPRFYFDDALSPQAQGTGTEEWGGGGDYWGGANMTLPLAGHPTGARSAKEAKNDEDKIQSAYRFLLADLFPFGRNAQIHLEHGGTNDSAEHYETVTYWYGLPAASLIQSDQLLIADERSEQSHHYTTTSPADAGATQASPPQQPAAPGSIYEFTSRYGPHAPDDRTETVRARAITRAGGDSEFTLNLDPHNQGVLLRRKLDYQFPNQRAQVFIAPADDPQNFKPAGTWYLPGSTTCVYSNPKDELGKTEHKVQTTDRRLKEDEFLLPLALTKNQSKIRVKIVFDPVNRPLFPGREVDPQAWSEISYTAYCWKVPEFRP
ncbi:MAG TPA: DUF2961 domain-containing protein [Tepidisphaeraceae bacterium]